ncbi:N-acetylgalactosamine kinase [Ceratina calcarata]|uniref:N-acetylgalactosamine kinase n=1 Tax=Ceratina calcarata TaxID=156304 RepID=A0AAJ7J771_9HYME|nr:N-acetylgalactosamine kinase [Ceratina calcarata]XP_017885854.1 N-acetylgalactosamine kinase [Ceratina calcarata]XP_026672326.1 N-acetylgalactosamine kinase [Ceratina calcarata]
MSANKERICDVEQVPVSQPGEKLSRRIAALTDHFQSKYNVKPAFFVRVPGRVNLIGEHIDYCGYAVCPMAIEQHILLAVAPSKDKIIQLTNIEPKYKDFKCNLKDIDVCIKHAGSGPDWYKYFLCGVKGALEAIPEECVPTGILAAVWGNIAPNSGLSSSSALVSAAVLSTVHANHQRFTKRELATLSADAERYIGTQGGGMDQAIAFLGKAGSAMLIEFNPLRGTDVTLPESAVFVIAHSQACHNKAATSDFNLRVAECRLAAQVIAKKRSKPWEHVLKLIDAQKSLGMSLDEMACVVTTDLHEEPYTLNEISECLDTTIAKLKESPLLQPFNDAQTFKLKQRALHVYQEAARVIEFQRINEAKNIAEDERLRRLGELMSASHESLHKLYECSHPRVDLLVSKAMACGALGARLTGAGWGGCVVAIVKKDRVSQFVDTLKEQIRQSGIEEGFKLDDLVFLTESNQGAAIYTI